MSASMRPTRAPLFARATARLTETVDLPTPHLPLETAITRPRCGYATGVGAAGRGAAGGFWSNTGSGRRALSMGVDPLLTGFRSDFTNLRDSELQVCLDALHQRGHRHVAIRAATIEAQHRNALLGVEGNEGDRLRITEPQQRPQPRDCLANTLLDRAVLVVSHRV